MAEPQGALSQMAPAAGMLPTASGGNTTLSDMLSGVLKQSQDKQGYLQQQRAAYDKEMERYAQQVAQMNTPAEEDAAPWGAMANAASTVAPTWGNMGAMLGRIGGAASESRDRAAATKLQAQQELVKTRQAEVRALESKDQNVALLKAMTGGTKASNPTIKVVDGKLVKYDPVTGETEVLSGSQDQIKARLFQNLYNKAVENEVPDPEAYAQMQTEKVLAQFGGTTVAGKSNNIPGVRPAAPTPQISMQITPQEQATRDAAGSRIRTGEQTGELGDWPKMPTEPIQPDAELTPEDAATAARLMARIKANPQAAAKDTVTLNNMMKKYEAAPPMQYLDKPKRKYDEKSSELTAEQEKVAEIERQKVLGKASAERVVAMPEAQGKLAGTINSFDDYLAELDSLKAHPGLEKATGWEGYIPFRGRVATTPGDSGDFLTKLEQVKSGALMETLKSIKALSSVGASGFGSLTEKEADRIIGAIAALDVSKQTPKALRDELGRIEVRIKNLKSLSEDAFSRSYPTKKASMEEAPQQGTKPRRKWNAEKGAFE